MFNLIYCTKVIHVKSDNVKAIINEITKNIITIIKNILLRLLGNFSFNIFNCRITKIIIRNWSIPNAVLLCRNWVYT